MLMFYCLFLGLLPLHKLLRVLLERAKFWVDVVAARPPVTTPSAVHLQLRCEELQNSLPLNITVAATVDTTHEVQRTKELE